MKIHPDILAAHAQFGGDLESMQKCYEFDDITQLSTLYSNAIARAEKAEEALRHFEWKPIGEADKNIEWMLLGIVRRGVLEETHIGGYRYAINDDEESCWWSDQSDDEIVPTHFMAFPAYSPLPVRETP